MTVCFVLLFLAFPFLCDFLEYSRPFSFCFSQATHVQAVLDAGVLSLSISFGQHLTPEQVDASREVISVSST